MYGAGATRFGFLCLCVHVLGPGTGLFTEHIAPMFRAANVNPPWTQNVRNTYTYEYVRIKLN